MARADSYNPKKRRTEEYPVQWRQRARAAPGTLLRVATWEWEEVSKCLESTHQRLRGFDVADMLRRKGTGERLRKPRGRSLDAAYRKLERFVALHRAAGDELWNYGSLLGMACPEWKPDDPDAAARWRAWDERSHISLRHAYDAMQGVRAAMRDLTMVVRILHASSSNPPGFTGSRAAWAAEADRLVRSATDEVAAARAAVWRMRRSVVLEFFAAWDVFSG